MNSAISSDRWAKVASISVFLLYSLSLSLPSGYSYGAALLLITSLAYLAYVDPPKIDHQDRIIILSLLSIFLLAVITLFLHNEKLKLLDQSSRFFLAIPVLWFLLGQPPRLTYLWAGLATGSITAAGVAFWQLHVLELERATGFVTSAIPFGNLGLVMGILCAAGLFWVPTRRGHRNFWRILLSAGALAGVYCSLASGSRGGWIALPPVVFIFFIAFLNRANLRRAIVLIAILVLIVAVLFEVSGTGIRARIDEATQQIDNYTEQHDAESSVGARLEAWRAALLNIPEKPLLGWSPPQYQERLRSQVQSGQVRPYVLHLSNSHNNYIEVLLFQGVIGLITLLALYFFAFIFFFRRVFALDRTTKVIAVCGSSFLVSFFVFGLTHVILGRNNGVIFFVLTLAILWACMRNAEQRAAAMLPSQ